MHTVDGDSYNTSMRFNSIVWGFFSELLNVPATCKAYLRDEPAKLNYCTCCHIERDIADQTGRLYQSQHTDTEPTSPSSDSVIPGARHGIHVSNQLLRHWSDWTRESRQWLPHPEVLGHWGDRSIPKSMMLYKSSYKAFSYIVQD